MAGIGSIFQRLDDAERDELDLFYRVLGDTLCRRVLARLAAWDATMSAADPPLEELGARFPTGAVFGLRNLERLGLAESEMVRQHPGVSRIFHATGDGRSRAGT